MWQRLKARLKRKSTTKRRMTGASDVRRQVGVGVLLLCIIGLLLTGIWYGSRVAALTLEEVTVVGGETIDDAEIQAVTEEVLGGSYFRLVPKRFSITYPADEIITRIEALPRVKEVRVEQVSNKELVVAFSEYTPDLLWCQVPGQEGGCYFVDRTGYAFVAAPELVGAALVRYYHHAVEPAVGNSPFSANFISETAVFIEQVLAETKLNIIAVRIPRDREVVYEVAGGGQILLSQNESLTDSYENLLTVLGSEQFVHLEPGNFKYIDLRYGNKVFVNEEIETGDATTTASSTGN